jgi:diguanylate cyclase (GGDEF)-like protein
MKIPSNAVDLPETVRQQKKISHRDPLTALPNRVFFESRLRQAVQQCRRRGQALTIVSLELDGFKSINDRYGKVVGDQVLSALAEAMKQSLRKGDLLARLCGQEFAAILPDLPDAEACVPVLVRLLEAATEAVHADGLLLRATVSIGVAFDPQMGAVDAELLLHHANQAMLQAKRAGRNLYHFFTAEDSHGLSRREDCIVQVRQALEAHEFVLYYQPKVNLSEGEVVGAEALIRWRHPQRGLLEPSEFLPLILDHELMIELDDWVLQTVLRQMEVWQESGLEISVSVNIGFLQWQQEDFPQRLAALLAEHPAIKPGRLELEIPGSSRHGDVDRLLKVVTACRKIGVWVALDHFGAGHLSIHEIQRIPANVLKIDPSFVHNILDSIEDLNILEGVLGLAAAFRRQFIAEGVETAEHGLLLMRLGCDLAQGYGIAHPMEAHNLAPWVMAWRPDPSWVEATTEGLDERLLVYTSVEHKSWIAMLGAYLRGEQESEPRLNRHQCQLGQFVDAEEQAGRSSQPAFQALAALHWRIHAMGAGIVKLRAQEKNEEGLARLADLEGLLAKLMEQMKGFRVKI